MRSINTHKITDKLFYENKGQILISAVFGMALAFLFQRICKDRKCIVIRAPNIDDITSKIYKFEDECFIYKPVSAKCPDDEKEVIKSV